MGQANNQEGGEKVLTMDVEWLNGKFPRIANNL